VRRESTLDAAVTLDQAAGLRERVSTGLTCRPTDDPFSQAVLADAERAARALSVRQFVPIRASRSILYGAAMSLIALVMLWLFPQFDLLGKAQAREQEQLRRQTVSQLRSELAKPVEAVKNLVEGNPELKGLKGLDDLEKLTRQDNKPLDP